MFSPTISALLTWIFRIQCRRHRGVESGLLRPTSKIRLKRVAWDPESSVKLPVEWICEILVESTLILTLAHIHSALGDWTLAETFRGILKQLPGAPGTISLVQAWLSYSDKLKIAVRNIDSKPEHSVTGKTDVDFHSLGFLHRQRLVFR